MTTVFVAQTTTRNVRQRASDLGLKVGVLPTGPLDAITDVAGVEVGHTTIIRGDDVRTAVTAILPHPGNLFRERFRGAVFVANAFGTRWFDRSERTRRDRNTDPTHWDIACS